MEYRYKLLLSKVPDNKLNAVKIITDMNGMDLKESYDLVKSAPVIVKETYNFEEAKAWVEQFAKSGITIDLIDKIVEERNDKLNNILGDDVI